MAKERGKIMKTVTYEQFLDFSIYLLETEEGWERLRKYKSWWKDGKTALDVLSFEEIETGDRLWIVLRPEFIEESISHEFACRCAERALSRIDSPDPRSVAAVEAKRAWLRGEISDDELKIAQDEARNAAEHAVKYTVIDAAWAAVYSAAREKVWSAAWFTAKDAENAAAWAAAWDTPRFVSWKIGWDNERQWQVNELRKILQE